MDVYIMRHGKTVWNEKGITQGRSRNRLSKVGVQVAGEVAKKYKAVPFDVIFVSPLTRTMQTANIINRYHNVKIVKDDDLIEIDQGIFTGRKSSSLTPEERALKHERSSSAKMESYQSCYQRAKSFLFRLEKSGYNNVLIVTHNCTASFLEDIIVGAKVDFSNAEFLRRFDNAEVKHFVI